MTTAAASSPICFAPLAHWLTMIVAGVKKAAAARAGRDRSVVALVTLLWGRLARLTTRFDALVARLAAGLPAAPRRQRTRPASIVPARTIRADTLRLPRGHDWLIRLLPGEAASYGSQLQALLAEPRMVALLAAAPEAGRILRPLCRLLAITPQGLLALPSEAGRPARQPRGVKPAAVAQSAIALICAAVTAQPPVAMDFTPTPERRRRRPWLRPP